jgi:hypothetical protein
MELDFDRALMNRMSRTTGGGLDASAPVRHPRNQPGSRPLKPAYIGMFSASGDCYVLDGLEDAEEHRPRVHQR